MGVALKSNFSKICEYADNLGFVLGVCNRFMVISTCFAIRHNRSIGFFLSNDANHYTKWFLNVSIEFSAAYILRVYDVLYDILEKAGHATKLNIMYNEASIALQQLSQKKDSGTTGTTAYPQNIRSGTFYTHI